MRAIFEAAKLLRKSVLQCNKWEFCGSLTDLTSDHLPRNLILVFKWFISAMYSPTNDQKHTIIDKKVNTLSQNAVYAYLTQRQLTNKDSSSFYDKHEFPQKLALGLSIHDATRSKKMIQLLHAFGLSVDYPRILQVENRIAQEIRKRMFNNKNIYIPPTLKEGRFVFFAVDYVDFSEDTPDELFMVQL